MTSDVTLLLKYNKFLRRDLSTTKTNTRYVLPICHDKFGQMFNLIVNFSFLVSHVFYFGYKVIQVHLLYLCAFPMHFHLG